MKDFIKTLDENLEYLGHETDGDIVRNPRRFGKKSGCVSVLRRAVGECPQLLHTKIP